MKLGVKSGCEMGNLNVMVLRPVERPRQNIEHIASIYRSLGSDSAEQVVTRALSELAFAMAGLADRVHAHELGDLMRRLKRLQKMAENLGLLTLADVTADLQCCFDRADSTAFSAVWSRLLRVAECTLTAPRENGGLTQL